MTVLISVRQRLEWSRAFTQAIAFYLTSHSIRKLQLGAGSHTLHNWFNTDLVPTSPEVFFLDSTRHFPIADSQFDYIFSEHHIEHISYEEGLFTLRECYRVLRPGGKIRLATPNLKTLLELYTESPNYQQQRYIQFMTHTFLPGVDIYSATFVINNAFRSWGHQFLYDHPTLQRALEEVGFVDITSATPGESTDEQFQALEMHGQFIGDEEINRFETMVLEGTRPL